MLEVVLSGIKNDYIYYAIIFTAFILAFITFVILNKNDLKTKLLTADCYGIIGVVIMLLFCKITNVIHKNNNSDIITVASVYYFLTAFTLTKFLAELFIKKLPKINVVLPIIIFTLVARIGCLYSGCCGGSIPCVEIEMGICSVAICVYLFYKKFSLSAWYIIYSVIRFGLDFFKETHAIERIGLFSLMQYVEIIGVAIALIIIINTKKELL